MEQNENQIDYQLECNSLLYDDGHLLTPEGPSSFIQHTKPKSPMKLMLTDFPDLNSEADESDSFKDFLRLEEEILKGSPSPNSVRGDRKNSVESEREGSDTQNEDRISPWYNMRHKGRLY